MKRLLSISLLATALWCATKLPPPEILGIRLGMSYAQAHARLMQVGTFKSQDEGQEVWSLRSDPHYRIVIVGFDRERRVRYVTVLVNPKGAAVDYSDLGDVRSAAPSGQPGNLVFTWKGRDQKTQIEYEAIAKGTEPHRLLTYSVKRLGAQNEEADEEQSNRKK